MLIECKSCGAKGNFDESRLPAGGANVSCPRCKEKIWVAPAGAPQPVRPAATAGTHAPSAAAATQGACAMCHGSFPRGEMVLLKGKWVCAACKPNYVQMLKIGLTGPGDFRYAGFWIRFAAKFLDGIITGIVTFVLLIPLNMAFAVSPDEMAAGPSAGFFLMLAVQLLVQIGLPAAYVTFFLGKFQATPGKMACGLKVLRADGEALSFTRAFGRHFAEMLSGMILLIGYIMAGFDSEKRALHDRICDTRVVYK